MSNVSFLEFQYKLSRNKFLQKPSRIFSSRSSSSRSQNLSAPTTVLQPSLTEMRQVFNKFDSNGDGKISRQEYKAVLRALNQQAMITDVPHIFKVADLDGDGFIDFNEFVQAQKKEGGGGVRARDIQSAFRTFDSNGDGRISAEEVMQVLRQLGERCSLDDCRRMVRAVDNDGDGLVNIDEFTTMMTQTLVHN